jgi:hypothetical protein
MTDGEHRRRRRRRASAPADQIDGQVDGQVQGGIDEKTVEPTGEVKASPRRRPRPNGTDRGLRDLVGAGRSQLGVDGALRGRDVNRPTDEDVAQAERELTIVRRNWRPPETH